MRTMKHTLITRRTNRLLTGLGLGLLLTGGALANTWPSEPIRLVVPFPPGGLADLAARPLATQMAEKLGQPVIIENRAGASGTIGTGYVATSKPDGYTLLFATANEIAVAPILYKNLNYTPFKSFTPISEVVDFPSILVSAPGQPITFAGLVTKMRHEKSGMSFASSGAGTTNHLMAELFRDSLGVPVLHVHYKGGSPAMADVAAKNVEAMFATLPSALGLIQGGRMQPLAVSSPKRSPVLPDVPSVSELGHPELAITIWAGVLGPAGLPPEVTRKLSTAIQQIVADPSFTSFLEKNGATPSYANSDDLKKAIADHHERWSKTIERAHITVDQ